MITIEQLEKASGIPVFKWAGKCYGMACEAAKLIEGSVPVYGHYLGPVHPKSMFASASKAGFVQHGWVKLPDGRILDPTRWAFETSLGSIQRRKAKPHIYIGPNDVYDEGGNKFRMQRLGRPPEFDPEEKIINIKPHQLCSEAWNFIEKTLGLGDLLGWDYYEPGDITLEQLHWIANQDPRSMEGHAKAIYDMLTSMKLIGLVPIDNKRMVERGEA